MIKNCFFKVTGFWGFGALFGILVTGSVDGKLRLWDIMGLDSTEDENRTLPRNCISELHGHEAAIMDIKQFNKCLLTSSEDGSCKIFDLSSPDGS